MNWFTCYFFFSLAYLYTKNKLNFVFENVIFSRDIAEQKPKSDIDTKKIQ